MLQVYRFKENPAVIVCLRMIIRYFDESRPHLHPMLIAASADTNSGAEGGAVALHWFGVAAAPQ